MAEPGAALLGGGSPGQAEGEAGWRAQLQLRPQLADAFSATQARAKATLSLDPRAKYLAQCDPDDPVHENMPLLRPDAASPMGAPVVAETVGHPTPKEMRAGLCATCCGACGLVVVLVVVLVVLLVDKTALACSQAAGASTMDAVPAMCVRPSSALGLISSGFDQPQAIDPLNMTLAACNTCDSAHDGVCDEMPPTAENPAGVGACAWGTDGLDCVVANQRSVSATRAAAALVEAGAREGTFVLQLTLWFHTLITVLSIVVVPVLLCTRKYIEQLPMVYDLLHEIVRSRALAVVEMAAFFLLAISIYYEVRLCHSSFTISPRSNDIPVGQDFGTSSWFTTWWPDDLAHAVASFRPEDSVERYVIFTAFASRFIMCNVANNQWQAAGKNITGMAFFLGVVGSWWSLIMVASDALYCRYPTDVGDGAGSFCTVFGDGLPEDGVPSKAFTTDCSLMQASGWNDTEVAYYQRFSSIPAPAVSFDFNAAIENHQLEVEMVPSKESAFFDAARGQAKVAANRTGLPAPVFPDSSDEIDFIGLLGLGTAPLVCPAAPGSLLEAVQQYSSDCEGNSRMRESMLLVSGLALLNLIEGVFMLKLAISVLSEGTVLANKHLEKLPEKRAEQLEKVFAARRAIGTNDASWLTWLVMTHAETTQDGRKLYFPTRMVASIVVSWLVLLILLSSVDLGALQISRALDEFESNYNTQIVPLLRDGLEQRFFADFTFRGKPIHYHNSYFDDPNNAGLDPRSSLPGFHKVDADCPCSLVRAAVDIGGDLAGHLAAVAAATGEMRRNTRRRVQTEGEACPENAFNDAGIGCTCNDGFFLSDRQECVPETIESHVKAIADIMQRNTTGAFFKCTMQTLREVTEPLPFAVRYAGLISCVIGAVSTALFMVGFRRKAKRLQELVEAHFDPVLGWPKDPTVLLEEDVRLLTGGKRSWQLDYAYLNRLPSFIGLYCGNFICAAAVQWVLWILILYFATCNAIPPGAVQSTIVFLLPVILESVLKKVIWGKIVDSKHGIRHPRLYAVVDMILSVLSTVTGPIKTFMRLGGAIVCLFAHLFRSDVTMMLDRTFLPLDPHYMASTGLLTGMRVQMEFNKIRCHSATVATRDDSDDSVGGMEPDDAGSIPLVELRAQGEHHALT